VWTHFPNASYAILYPLLVVISLYCRYKSVVGNVDPQYRYYTAQRLYFPLISVKELHIEFQTRSSKF
jgi:hypothetical protein